MRHLSDGSRVQRPAAGGQQKPSPQHMRPHGLCSRHICRSAVPSHECAMMMARRREVTTLHAVESWGRQHIRACSSWRPHDMSRSITTLQAGHAQAGDARDAQADRARGAQGKSWAAALCVRRCCLEARQSERHESRSDQHEVHGGRYVHQGTRQGHFHPLSRCHHEQQHSTSRDTCRSMLEHAWREPKASQPSAGKALTLLRRVGMSPGGSVVTRSS